MRTGFRPFWLAALAIVPLTAAFGGWAVVTVASLPDYAVAGQPLRLEFTIRQHGFTLLTDLSPTVDAAGGSSVAARPLAAKGHYEATVVVPAANPTSVTINSGFGNSRVTLLPINVVAAGATAPVPLADADRGRRLFVAKGCFNCHTHRDVDLRPIGPIGPDLTDRHLPVEYLRQQISNPRDEKKMPNLELQPAEVAAITAFLSAESLGLR